MGMGNKYLFSMQNCAITTLRDFRLHHDLTFKKNHTEKLILLTSFLWPFNPITA